MIQACPSTPVEEVIDALGEGLIDAVDGGDVGELGAGNGAG